jgi:exopolysaccharide production protein ExoF
MQMYRDLMTEAARNDPTLAASAAQPAAAPTIIYSIVRETDGKTEELHADENTPVLPGDVVKAEMTLPATVNSN